MVWDYWRRWVVWALHHDIQLHFALRQGLLLLAALHQLVGQTLLLGFNLKPSIQVLQVVGVKACAVELALQLQIFNKPVSVILG